MRHHPDPTGFGYATSPNFNEMYAKKMAELSATTPTPRRQRRVPKPAEPTALHYATSPNLTAKVNQRLSELGLSSAVTVRPRPTTKRQPRKVKRPKSTNSAS